MKRLLIFICVFGFVVYFFNVPASAGRDATEAAREKKEVEKTISRFKEKDPSIKKFFDKAYGYAVFPDVGGGAFILGFVEGEGLVYEQGEIIGRSVLNKATAGLQAGGQNFSEIIFFKDKAALETLKSNDLKLSRQASAVVVTAGAAIDIDYEEGVAVFTMRKGGLMLEASVGGQQFKYEPLQP